MTNEINLLEDITNEISEALEQRLKESENTQEYIIFLLMLNYHTGNLLEEISKDDKVTAHFIKKFRNVLKSP